MNNNTTTTNYSTITDEEMWALPQEEQNRITQEGVVCLANAKELIQKGKMQEAMELIVSVPYQMQHDIWGQVMRQIDREIEHARKIIK